MKKLRPVRVMLRNGEEHTFPNTEYQADFRTGWFIVYQLVGQEREEIAYSNKSTCCKRFTRLLTRQDAPLHRSDVV